MSEHQKPPIIEVRNSQIASPKFAHRFRTRPGIESEDDEYSRENDECASVASCRREQLFAEIVPNTQPASAHPSGERPATRCVAILAASEDSDGS